MWIWLFVHTAFWALTTAKYLFSQVSFNPAGAEKSQFQCEFCAAFFVMLLSQGLNIRDSWLKIADFILGVRDGWQGTKCILGGVLEIPKIRSYAHFFPSLSPTLPSPLLAVTENVPCILSQWLLSARRSLPDGACADLVKAWCPWIIHRTSNYPMGVA